jgi:hypothetical protein
MKIKGALFYLNFGFFFIICCNASENFTFDRLFPSSVYEKAYKAAAYVHYDIQRYQLSDKTEKISTWFLERQWDSLLRLYVLIKDVNESGQAKSHIQDYGYLYNLIEWIGRDVKNLDLSGDFFISSKVLLATILKIMRLELVKVNCAKIRS